MTREIKFRAWDKKVNQMINHLECIQFHQDGNITAIKSLYDLEIKNGQNSGVYERLPDKFILMQYTGLKDKNGKEIYEGDILRFDFSLHIHDSDINPNEQKGIGQVFWIDKYAAFAIKTEENQEWYESLNTPTPEKAKEIQIIGNIYENKELLEGGDK